MQELIKQYYKALTNYLIANKLTISTMESMTGGLIASLLTDTEGASAVIKGAFVTYSNEAKIKQGVPAETIAQYGVYSKETARAMAKAARSAYCADIGIGVTGSTGNVDPNNSDSVPGVVYIGVSAGGSLVSETYEMPMFNSRIEYKLYAAQKAYEMLAKIYPDLDNNIVK